MKVVSFKICPFVQRVIAHLEAGAIDHEVLYISLRDKPDWFLEISPNAQVPVLITDAGVALFESDAIVEYVEEAWGPLQPELAPEERALSRAWSTLATKHYLTQCGAQRSASAAVLEERAARLGVAFDRIETRLGDTPFFAGAAVGRVDLAWLTLLHRAAIIEARSGYDFLGARPKLKRWQAALMETGLAERSVAPDFETAFAAFYLSDETYLGRGGAAAAAAAGACC
ncbi:MAG: glutathione S-transferase family protein [Pseudomonadota bacterium]